MENSWYHYTGFQVRLGYGAIFVLMTIIAWFMRDVGSSVLKHISFNSECPNNKCYGRQAVLRISLAMFVFFITYCVMMIGYNQEKSYFRTRLQNGFWFLKALVLILLLLFSLLLPNSVLLVYGYFCMVGAAFFVFLQVILIVDFAHQWNESWVAKEWYKQIVIISGLMYVASVVLYILMYIWFAPGCGVNIFLICFTLFMSILLTYVSLREDVEKGSLLAAASITGLCTYLLFSALLNGEKSCNPFSSNSSHAETWTLVIGVIFALVSLCWNTIGAASMKGVFNMTAKDEHTVLLESAGFGEQFSESYNHSYFHLVMASGSMYMAMLFTSWNLNDVESLRFDTGPIGMWVKIISAWLTMMLYLWSLIGPILCPHREWD